MGIRKMMTLFVIGSVVMAWSGLAIAAGETPAEQAAPAAEATKAPKKEKRKKAAKMCQECGKPEIHCECAHSKEKDSNKH